MSSLVDSKSVARSRRQFLKRSTVTLGAAAMGLPILTGAKECILTEQEVLGPMYNYGASLFQRKLASDDEPGQKLILRGAVYNEGLPHALARYAYRNLACR